MSPANRRPPRNVLAWPKHMCHGLALIVEHQKSGDRINWANVLTVFNATFPQQLSQIGCDDGLDKPKKLQARYADKDRGKTTGFPKKAWNFYEDACSDQEVQQMLDTADEVIRQEIRLSQVPRSRVLHPGPSPSRWSSFRLTLNSNNQVQLNNPQDLPTPARTNEPETNEQYDQEAPLVPEGTIDNSEADEHGYLIEAEPNAEDDLYPHTRMHNPVLPLGNFAGAPAAVAPQNVPNVQSFDDHIHTIRHSPALLMLHTTTVDFTSDPPTIIIQDSAPSPLITPDTTNETSNVLYCAGEVRKIIFKDYNSDRIEQLDCMLCDINVCTSCNPQAQHPFMSSAWIGRQNPHEPGGMPLVHQTHLMETLDGTVQFNPSRQSPITVIAPRGPLVKVQFSNGMIQEVICCNQRVCEICSHAYEQEAPEYQ
ncbi:hypothetical protein Q7P37_002335 [Cladosporium fusiforme]